MNYLLILNGYPPGIIHKGERSRYISALQRAQVQKDYRGLVELVARAVLDNLNRLLLSKLAGDETWLPLSATADYLRKLADQGKLAALKQGGHWVSTRRYLEAYTAPAGVSQVVLRRTSTSNNSPGINPGCRRYINFVDSLVDHSS